MEYITLYRKYRPKTFNDVVGQKIIVDILKNSIINNKIGHAYIFSGPRGTGKTSIAKIFSKAVNCLNHTGDLCNNCDVCLNKIDSDLDIIEIDAASNNGVDEIREIRNTVKLMPTNLKYRVYIIDEVHMLSISAFNALLKTLEEPPSYAIFILATTELNKIPTTVLSRCQKFDFKKINNNDIICRLKYILECENKQLDDDVINLISNISNGGLRDAINLLDQVLSLNKSNITIDDIYDLIGDISSKKLYELFDSIIECNINNIIKLINEFYESGKNFTKICSKLENLIKDLLIFNNMDNYFDNEYEEVLIKYSKYDLNKFIDLSKNLFELENELKKNINQRIVIEIYFIKMAMIFKNQDISLPIEKVEKTNNSLQNSNDIEEEKIIINNCLATADKVKKEKLLQKIDKINDLLNTKKYNSIANLILKSTIQVVSDKEIILSFKNDFEVVLFYKNINEVIKLFKKITNIEYNIAAITEEKWEKIKNEYINNKKNGVKYEYIELKKTKNIKIDKLENELDDIFGEIKIMEE